MLLSKEQEKIVFEKINTNMRILACAGSGKTTTMIQRIVYMIKEKGCLLEEFFIVTFTKNAAKDICKRLNEKLVSLTNIGDSEETAKIKCGTFHALAQRILSTVANSDDDIYNSNKDLDFKFLRDNFGTGFDDCPGDLDEEEEEKNNDGDDNKYNEDDSRNDEDGEGNNNNNKTFDKPCHIDESQYYFLHFLKSNHPDAVKLKKTIKYIFVDEFQDVNDVQYEIIKQLSSAFGKSGTKTKKESERKEGRIKRKSDDDEEENENTNETKDEITTDAVAAYVTVIGDDNQNIYTFRGSNVKYIKDFPDDFPLTKTFYLSTNYRSSHPIVNLSNLSIACNKNQLDKPTAVSGALTLPRTPSSFPPSSTSSSSSFPPSSTSSSSSPPLSSSHLITSSPEGLKGHVKLVSAPCLWNTMCGFEGVKLICDEIYNLIVRQDVLPKEICILSRNGSLLRFAEENLTMKNIRTTFFSGEKSGSNNNTSSHNSAAAGRGTVVLSTIHSSKGLEWEHVYIIGMHKKYFPDFRETDVERERRLFYVAVTRAKKYLTLSNSSTEPSRFISELPWKTIFFVKGSMSLKEDKKSLNDNQPQYDMEGEDVKSVENCIRSLNGLHYIYLKDKVLPRNLSSLLKKKDKDNENEQKSNEERKEFEENMKLIDPIIQAEFGQFLHVLTRRMIGELTRCTSLVDESSERCTSKDGDKTRSVPRNYTALLSKAYEEYKNVGGKSWKDILDKIYLVSLCSSIVKGSRAILHMPISKKDLSRFSKLYELIFGRMESLVLESSSLLVQNNGYEEDLDESKIKPVLMDVLVSENFSLLSSRGGEGKEEKEKKNTRNREKMVKIKGKINLLLNEKVAINFKYYLDDGDSDANSSGCQLDDFLEIITCASLWNLEQSKKQELQRLIYDDNSLKDKKIETVGIYNLADDTLFLLSLGSWKKSRQLCNFLANF